MSLCHTKLSYEFCSLQKKTLNNVTIGMPLRMCPKHLNLDTSNNETKGPIISTCPNALAHILGTTSLLPSQSTANFTDWFAYRFDSWRSCASGHLFSTCQQHPWKPNLKTKCATLSALETSKRGRSCSKPN